MTAGLSSATSAPRPSKTHVPLCMTARDRSVPEYQEIAVTPIRRTIAERMVQSAQTAAGVTLSTTVDATNLVNLRQQFKAVAGAGEAPAIAFTDIIVKLTAWHSRNIRS